MQARSFFSREPLPSVMEVYSWNILWSFCFGLLAAMIVVGNLLTIWIFLKQRLRKRAHFLLISLAVADLLVGLLSVPLYIVAWYVDQSYLVVVTVYALTDIFTGIASIYTLAAISLERMYAIGWPFRHRTLNFRFYIFAIAVPWILTAIFTSISLLRFLHIITGEQFIPPLILFQITPLLVMCTAYFIVWKKQKTMMGNQNHVVRETRLATSHMVRETRLTKTLFIIIGASLLTWVPFQIWNLLMSYFGAIRSLPYIITFLVKFLQFSNSLVNVIVYPFRISEFKNALLQMFHCCVSTRNRRNEVAPIRQSRVGQLHHCQELQVF